MDIRLAQIQVTISDILSRHQGVYKKGSVTVSNQPLLDAHCMKSVLKVLSTNEYGFVMDRMKEIETQLTPKQSVP